MSDNSSTSAVADEEPTFEEAQKIATRQQRKEMVGRIRELRRQRDASKERAAKAQQRYEKAVVLLASDKPEREDWYEYAGMLPRKMLLEAAGLTTVSLHRIMERYRKQRSQRNGRPKRAR